MQAFHGAAGQRAELNERISRRLHAVTDIKGVRRETRSFSLEVFDNTRYWPFSRQPLYDKRKDRYLYISGYLWHDDASHRDTVKLESLLRRYADEIVGNGAFALPPGFSGIYNLILFDSDENKLYVTCDSGGLFPFYYLQHTGTLTFSSHLHLMGKALHLSLDHLGVVQRLNFGWTIGERTLYKNVKRLSPGQSLIYDVRDETLRCGNAQEFFQDTLREYDLATLSEIVWTSLCKACERIRPDDGPIGIMLSGGLDSRMVVAAAQTKNIPMITCTHGQERYHEVEMAKRVSGLALAKHHFIDLDVWSCIGGPEDLEAVFWASDYTHYPVWRLGGQLLREKNVAAITSGYLLDVTLGGSYFDLPSKTSRLWRRLCYAIGGPQEAWPEEYEGFGGVEKLEKMLSNQLRETLNSKRPLLKEEYATHLDTLVADSENDVSAELQRLRDTGTVENGKLFERFHIEHRGRKQIFSQELTARIFAPVVVPTYDRDLMRVLSRVPIHCKLQHHLYFDVLRTKAREYARIPASNSAIPPSWPKVMIEVARALRNRFDHVSNRVYMASHGRIGRGHFFGSMGFESVARGQGNLDALETVFRNDASSTIFDTDGICEEIDRIRRFEKRAMNLQDLSNMASIQFADVL